MDSAVCTKERKNDGWESIIHPSLASQEQVSAVGLFSIGQPVQTRVFVVVGIYLNRNVLKPF